MSTDNNKKTFQIMIDGLLPWDQLPGDRRRSWIILAIPTLGITLLLALYEYLKLRSIEQGVTNKRVILKTGFISRHTEEMKLNSIETVEIRQGVMGRMFGFGTIEVTGRGLSDVIFKGVDDPMSVKRRIESVSNPIT
ncbi:MAG: hypothetical protein CVV10_09330 [Gammaproteobacteria bacterium HGW-Gammaproteobacteria-14]|nr:MAG: hypothetical protein CVV10_09330 [Gammaproteobacteria bacterium HGW-Gammaproteobacteria-14]